MPDDPLRDFVQRGLAAQRAIDTLGAGHGDDAGRRRSSRPTNPRMPAWALCGACGHAFVYAYTPILLDLFIRQMKRATCPHCAETRRLFLCDHPPTDEDRADVLTRTAALEARGRWKERPAVRAGRT